MAVLFFVWFVGFICLGAFFLRICHEGDYSDHTQ